MFTTSAYMLQKPTGEIYGFIKGYVSMPDYFSEIKVHFIKAKEFEGTEFDIEDFRGFLFKLEEIEEIKKGMEIIENQLKTLIDLSKRNQLKTEFYD